mmetsp:Transcript_7541/g.18158  ORF Transcript_7541/g.18158 Transcript_7541/m.18158 type:complete len:215 (+) Transcript_7541:1347-1991(+)
MGRFLPRPGYKTCSIVEGLGSNPRIRCCIFDLASLQTRKCSAVTVLGISRSGSYHICPSASPGTANSSQRGHQSSYSNFIFVISSRRRTIPSIGFVTIALSMDENANCESLHFLSHEARPLIRARSFSLSSNSFSVGSSGSLSASSASASPPSCSFSSCSVSTIALSSSTPSSIFSSLTIVFWCSDAQASTTLRASHMHPHTALPDPSSFCWAL